MPFPSSVPTSNSVTTTNSNAASHSYASLPAMFNGPSIWAMGGLSQGPVTRDVDSSNALKAFLGIGTPEKKTPTPTPTIGNQDWTASSSSTHSTATTKTPSWSEPTEQQHATRSWQDPWDTTTSSMSNLNLNTMDSQQSSFNTAQPQLSPPIVPSTIPTSNNNNNNNNDQRTRRKTTQRRSRSPGRKNTGRDVGNRRRRSGRSRHNQKNSRRSRN